MEILTLGEKIRRRRKSLRLTLKDVAGDSVTPAQLSYVESDKCKPSNSLLKYICSKIDLDMDYLLECECDQARKYCDYYIKEYEFYMRRGEYKEAEDKLLNIEKLAQEYKLDRYLGIISYRRGMNFLEKGDNDFAEYNLLTAMQIFMKLREEEYKADCYYILGKVAMNRDYIDNALEFFNDAVELMKNMETRDHLRLCKIYTALAKVYFRMGEFQECEKRICEAIWEARETGDVMIIADVLQDAALMTYEPSSLPRSDGYIDEAMKIYNDNMQIRRIPQLMSLKAYIHIKFGDYTAGMACLEDVLKDSNAHGDANTMDYLLKAADLLLDDGHADFADTMLESLKCTSDDKLVSEHLYLKAKACKDVDETKSREYLEKSADSLRKLNSRDMLIRITNDIGKSYILDKKYSKALEYLMESAKLFALKVV